MSRFRWLALLSLAVGSNACARPQVEPNAQLARERIVSLPSSIAFVSSDRVSTGLSGELRFGGPLGRSALYLKFPTDWRSRGIPRRAFLALFPREGGAISDIPVTLEAWRISADWQPRSLRHWSDKPSLAPPYAHAQVTSSPPRVLRLDVTELVRFAAHNPERDFGIAVIASGGNGPAAIFDSGFAGGVAPRLEIYLR